MKPKLISVPVGSVRTLTLGSHGDTMVPVPSACTVDGKPLTDPKRADEGHLLPIGDYKGSGLSLIIGLLAGITIANTGTIEATIRRA